MEQNQQEQLCVTGAGENNLKEISLSVPHDCVIAVTGVSGSGKSSLAFDVIYAESRYRFISHLSGQSRMLFSRLNRPNAESITGLRPAIAVDQRTLSSGPRSTVGTLTEIYDYLRLLFARLGKSDNEGLQINRGLFSFNLPQGACPRCKGLGVVDFIDPALLISDENKSLREGALVITTPTGYIIYSQVTMEVLNQVCRAEGFHVDIPWKDLTDEQKNIIMYGSEKIRIPFGKHTLESRMKWTGITAKPREEGYYRGILPIMEEILKRDRNDNILRFARTAECPGCKGRRLCDAALSVRWNGWNIADMSAFTVEETDRFFSEYAPSEAEQNVFGEIAAAILRRTAVMKKLGLEYLCFSRSSASLSGGEAQRLRLATQAASSLQGVIYVLDEPTAGLHPADSVKLMQVLREICDRGNTVLVVEHDENIIRNADYIIDIGPGAGDGGGQLLFSGSLTDFMKMPRPESPTYKMMTESVEVPSLPAFPGSSVIEFTGLTRNNVINGRVSLCSMTVNVISGVSGAGKSSLAEALTDEIRSNRQPHPFGKVVYVDQQPIGRTSRSNPVTYTKVFDTIRKLYAAQPQAKAAGWKQSDFSFNTGSGRCPACEGAGVIQTGMHFMGTVEIVCEQCHGQRYIPQLLEVNYKGKSVQDVLSMRISEALLFFNEVPAIAKTLAIMNELGLGYLFAGQNSATLSGGEAQRIKLAAELASPSGKNCLYVFDEPTTGLHQADVGLLSATFSRLCEKGHTVLCIEHHDAIIKTAGHVIDMGPGSGNKGGRVLYCGSPSGLLEVNESVTAKFLQGHRKEAVIEKLEKKESHIRFNHVFTHNLKDISVAFPRNAVTVVNGRSGSGKTSLVFDTVYAECHQRFTENWSAYIRTHLPQLPGGDFTSSSGVGPAIAVRQEKLSDNPRSTVGTYTGVYDLLRLLFSRAAVGQEANSKVYSSLFSFNHQDGACPACRGLGENITVDPDKIITHPGRSVLNGAMDGTKTGKFYGDVKGQYVAAMIAVGKKRGIDFSKPWHELGESEKYIIMYGTGDVRYSIEWKYARGEREGVYRFEKEWPGLVALVDEEYSRKHADHRGDAMLPLMKTVVCVDCGGSRLKKEALQYRIEGRSIHDLSQMEVDGLSRWLRQYQDAPALRDYRKTVDAVTERLDALTQLSLGYLSSERSTMTLSGGERQRLKLAGILSQSFSGVTFILDEPASGLHPSDRAKIATRLEKLREGGNTVIIVEHQNDFAAIADHIITMGPGAGSEGGEIVFEGSYAAYCEMLKQNQPVVTGVRDADTTNPVPFREDAEFLEIGQASKHNLRNIDVKIPLQTIVSITGVSGSGKTTLLREILNRSLLSGRASGCVSFRGGGERNVIYCSPSQAGKSGAGLVMTYSGIAEPLRKYFAASLDAKKRGLTTTHFSVHSPGGRCETCKGTGVVKVSMDFLPDVELPCSDCDGRRFLASVLDVCLDRGNIHDYMNLTVNGLLSASTGKHTKEQEGIMRIAESLAAAGLGHLVTGQRLSSLSGGEWQRLQLIVALKDVKEPSIILMDEPASGLSAYDIRMLGLLFLRLVSEGHSLIFTEHQPEMIGYAGWNVELGPGGGNDGGALQYCGPAIHL